MTNKATKYGLMTIAAVLLVAMAFSGAASAVQITADQWNSMTTSAQINGNETYVFTGSGIIYPKYNGSSTTIYSTDDTKYVPNRSITFDFTNYQGTFAGVNSASTDYQGALFGDITNETYSGTITIKNLALSGVTVKPTGPCSYFGGIIGNFKGKSIADSKLNFTNCTLANCTIGSMSGIYYVGGLVGYAGPANVNVVDCKVKHCDVVLGSSCVGGLIGCVAYESSANFLRCKVMNSTVASTGKDSVGGFAGYAYITSFAKCGVENTSVYSKTGGVGGLVGNADSASNTPYMNESMVKNCVIAAGDSSVGGLVGYVSSACANGFSGCEVLNSTIAGVNNVGGLIGVANSASATGSGNSVQYCAVRGTNANARLDCGATWHNLGCAVNLNENFIYNRTSAPYNDDIKLYDVNGNLITSLSAVNATFWNTISNATGYNASKFGGNTQQVTYLGQYGAVDGYGAYLPVYTVTYDGNSAPSGEVPQSQRDLAGTIITVADKSTLAKMGYNFTGWNFGTTTGELKQPGDKFALTANTTLYANWTVNTTTVPAFGSYAEFGNENITAIRSTSGVVVKVLLEDVGNVEDTNVVFTADNATLNVPDLNGYTKDEEIAVFEIDASVLSSHSEIVINVTFKDAATATANKDKIKFSHYNTQNNAWDNSPLALAMDAEQDGASVEYSVKTTSFSPFGIGLYTAIPQQYTPSSSKQTGSTVILQEGQVAPTAYATAAPTVASTVKPTEKPATPTVIATEKPTTQATQQSPAPFIGILAGLGAAAVLLRLRK